MADNAECLDLPEALVPLAAELSATPSFRCTFDKLPTTFGMVELDRIVVSQRRVTQPFVEAQRARLDPRPDLEGLFRFCQPLERRDPPVTIRRLGGQRVAFASTSNDLRFLDAELLRPDQISRCDSVGPIGAVVGLVVGYGSNFLSVIRSDNRMLLHNGYHRACALRAAGFTHAPAVIQTVTRRDELELASTQAVIDNPAFFFRAKRPPVLKDFFDPRIRTVLRARRFEKLVEVSFEVRDCTATQAWSGTHPRKRRPGGRPDCSDRRRSPSNRTGGLARCCSRRRPRTPSTPRSQPCWRWARQRDLRDRELVTEAALRSVKQDALDQALALQTLERQRTALARARLEIETAQAEAPLREELQIAEIDRSVAGLEQELAEAEAARAIVIAAPQAGMVTALRMSPGPRREPRRAAASACRSPSGSSTPTAGASS